MMTLLQGRQECDGEALDPLEDVHCLSAVLRPLETIDL